MACEKLVSNGKARFARFAGCHGREEYHRHPAQRRTILLLSSQGRVSSPHFYFYKSAPPHTPTRTSGSSKPVPLFYKIDTKRKLVLTTGSGVLTLADSLAHQDRLSKDADFSREFSQLIDLVHVTEVALTAEDIRQLAKTAVFSSQSRRAILVNNDLKFGLARMFETFRDLLGEKGIRVFRNLNDALAWVLDHHTGG